MCIKGSVRPKHLISGWELTVEIYNDMFYLISLQESENVNV